MEIRNSSLFIPSKRRVAVGKFHSFPTIYDRQSGIRWELRAKKFPGRGDCPCGSLVQEALELLFINEPTGQLGKFNAFK